MTVYDRPRVWTFRTAEWCWEISQGYAFLRTPGILRHSAIRTLKGCRGLLAPLPGCDSWCVSIPGLRKKRVPLANLLAPLRGAEASVLQQHSDDVVLFGIFDWQVVGVPT